MCCFGAPRPVIKGENIDAKSKLSTLSRFAQAIAANDSRVAIAPNRSIA